MHSAEDSGGVSGHNPLNALRQGENPEFLAMRGRVTFPSYIPLYEYLAIICLRCLMFLMGTASHNKELKKWWDGAGFNPCPSNIKIKLYKMPIVLRARLPVAKAMVFGPAGYAGKLVCLPVRKGEHCQAFKGVGCVLFPAEHSFFLRTYNHLAARKTAVLLPFRQSTAFLL